MCLWCLCPQSFYLHISHLCIFSIHVPSMCPRLSDLLVAAIYKLCLNSSSTPLLHFSKASLLPFLPIQNSFHPKDYTSPFQVFFQGSLSSFCFLTCCLMLIFTCFSHVSSCSLLTLSLLFSETAH